MGRRQATERDYEQRLLRVQQWVQEHLDEPLEPQSMARAAHFSMHHFHRVFRAQMGETVMHHVRRLRLERAARKLRSTELRIIELALEAGYESHEAFTRAFADQFEVTPSDYREQPSTRLARWHAQKQGVGVAVEVKAYPAMRVAFMRHRGSYATAGQSWQRMLAWVHAQGLNQDGRGLYGICPDDPDVTPEVLLRFDTCLAEIPAGTYAVGMHVGPYEMLSQTYLDVIGRWFPASGYDLAADAVVEHYVTDPATTRPQDLHTEVRVRIAEV